MTVGLFSILQDAFFVRASLFTTMQRRIPVNDFDGLGEKIASSLSVIARNVSQ